MRELLARTRHRDRAGGAGLEIVAALSAASQMALLCPPGFDEWVRRELIGDAKIDHRRNGHAHRRR